MSFARGLRHRVFARERREWNRRGAILVLAAIMLIVVMGLLALSVDVGYMMNVKTELKRATDAAALAGAGALIDGADAAKLQSLDFMLRNPVGSQVLTEEENREALLREWLAQHPDAFQVAVGQWDPDTRTFAENEDLPSTIRVVANRTGVPLFFGRVFGQDSFDIRAESIARYQPRDIALVLDFSASMNDDSELRRISEYGESAREAVEASLLQIYHDLNPSYGSLHFEPDYVTLTGAAPTSECDSQIHVKFIEKTNQVYVASDKDLSNVVLGFYDGTTQKIEPLSDPTGTFGGGSKKITKIWVKSGCNESGEGPGYGERFELDWTDYNSVVKQCFGLDSIPYPYPSGSWDGYIDYVQTSSYVRDAGYKKMYGYMTLINYWLEQKPTHSQTPDLWMASAQPVTALKNAVGVFMIYIQEVDCQDRVALAIYNDPSQNALLEQPLTEDFAAVEDIVDHRQAGHYDQYTNIGAGIREGYLELDAHARAGSKRMIVLMTDGIANKPSNSSYARSYALQQAQYAADRHYPIVTISLGNAADTDLMQQIADTTKGIHFNLPGGESVTDYEAQLLAVFRQIADDRPLALVK
jgi:Flp pilus assembly protein TadG